MRDATRRRIMFAVLIVIFGLLTAYPEKYRAAATLAPTDPSSLGLSGALGQLGAVNTLFGSQAQVEISLKIGRSSYTREVVIKRLDLVKKMGFKDAVQASRWLAKNVEITSLRGGIVQVECISKDPVWGRTLVTATTEAMRERLAEIAVRQTSYKRQVLLKLVKDANQDLADSQQAYNLFRLQTRYSNPAYAIGAIGERIPVLQAAIKAKQVELTAAREFATDDNMSVRQIVAQIDALKQQLNQFQALNPQEQSSIGRVVKQSTEAEKLERDLLFSKALYFSYRKYLEGTSVEDLTSSANVRILEAPFIDTERQYNFGPMCMAILLFLLALAIEFYGMRPPVGDAGHE
jgi:uncharacterized protein involved in exopolysaccharide biosynthesis